MHYQNGLTAIELGQERQQQMLQEARQHQLLASLSEQGPQRWERWLFTAGNLFIVLGRRLQRRYLASLNAGSIFMRLSA